MHIYIYTNDSHQIKMDGHSLIDGAGIAHCRGLFWWPSVKVGVKGAHAVRDEDDK